jgi:hypothetical protein
LLYEEYSEPQEFYSLKVHTSLGQSGLSEEATAAHLEEKIGKTETNRKVLSFPTTLSAAFFGWFLIDFFQTSSKISLSVAAICLLSGILSGALEIHYGNQKKSLMKQLKETTKGACGSEKCPKCGRELLRGNFAYCPYCGASLE